MVNALLSSTKCGISNELSSFSHSNNAFHLLGEIETHIGVPLQLTQFNFNEII